MAEVSEKVLSKKDEDNDTLKETLKEWHSYIEGLKLKWSDSRTARYWLMFMRFISIVRMISRAERTGNWDLHLKDLKIYYHILLPLGIITTQNMLAFIYKRVAICMDVLGKPCQIVFFTIRRNPSLSGLVHGLTFQSNNA